jgi:hypothetical protein
MKKLAEHPFRANRHTLKKALAFFYYFPVTIIEKIKLNQLAKPSA